MLKCSIQFKALIVLLFASACPQLFAGRVPSTDVAIRDYVTNFLAKNREFEIERIALADISPYIGDKPSEEELRLEKLLLETKVPVPEACLQKAQTLKGKIQITLVTEGHADPNSVLEEALIVQTVAATERNFLLLEGKTANLPQLYGGKYTAKASLSDWGKNVHGWECPSSGMYTDLMYGIPAMMQGLSFSEGKARAWDILSLLYAKNPPEFLSDLLKALPEKFKSSPFGKSMQAFVDVRIKDRSINPFVEQPYRTQMNKLFESSSVDDIALYVQNLFLTYYTQKLAAFMKLESPELPETTIDELVATLPDPIKNIWSILDARLLNAGYRDRCAVKSIIAQVCEQLEKSTDALNVNVIMGRAHLVGIESQMNNSFPEATLVSVDNWKKYIDMSVENRIIEANRIRALLPKENKLMKILRRFFEP